MGRSSEAESGPFEAGSTARPGGATGDRAARTLWAKLVRYALSSVVGVVLGQSLLLVFSSVLEWPAVAANVMSVALSTPPVFLLNRRWVWLLDGRADWATEVLPFWLMTGLGLAVSSVFVWLAERWWPDERLLVNVANMAGFGVVWVFKFVALDRILFAVVDESA